MKIKSLHLFVIGLLSFTLMFACTEDELPENPDSSIEEPIEDDDDSSDEEGSNDDDQEDTGDGDGEGDAGDDGEGDTGGEGEGDTGGDTGGEGEGDTGGDTGGEGEGDTGGDTGGEGEGDTGGDTGGEGEGDTGDGSDNSCDVQDYIFVESNGYLLAEIEKNSYSDPWSIDTSESDYSGEGYIVWNGQQYLSSPGNGLTTFKIQITNPGTYQFVWRSAVVIGSSGTDHNDSWLRFPDADDFYAQKGTSIVYPKGSGQTPNPAGAGADGWFKVWRSGGNLAFKWQAVTFDSNSHQIYVTFDNPGEYTMEVSARSSGHAIDKFVLFQDSYSLADVTGESTAESEIECGN